MIKSPFYVVQDFLSPKQCEELVSQYQVKTPNTNLTGDPVKLEKTMEPAKGQTVIMQKLREHIPLIEQHYDATYRGTESLVLTHYPEFEKAPAEQPGCENSKYIKRKWLKIKDVDLTGIIWLKEYHDSIPLDPRYEVYGGKTEFPTYNFSLVPQRGSLIIFPAYPHFVHCISPILVGDLYQIKVNIALSHKNGGMWMYQPKEFQANGSDFIGSWFKDFL
jgi:hypothetical protein